MDSTDIGYSPGAAKVWEKVSSVSSAADLNVPFWSPIRCGLSSAFFQVTVVPAVTVRVAGAKAKLSISTVAGLAAAATTASPAAVSSGTAAASSAVTPAAPSIRPADSQRNPQYHDQEPGDDGRTDDQTGDSLERFRSGEDKPVVPEQKETAGRGDATVSRERCSIDHQRAQQPQREWCGARWPRGRERPALRLQQVTYRERDGHASQEQAAKRRRHLPKRANSTIGREERGRLAEAAWRLPRIGRYGGELANSTLCRIA